MTQEQVLETFKSFEQNLDSVDEVAEFNKVAASSRKDNSMTFSFSLNDDAIDLIRKEKQKERDRQGGGGTGEMREASQPVPTEATVQTKKVFVFVLSSSFSLLLLF